MSLERGEDGSVTGYPEMREGRKREQHSQKPRLTVMLPPCLCCADVASFVFLFSIRGGGSGGGGGGGSGGVYVCCSVLHLAECNKLCV